MPPRTHTESAVQRPTFIPSLEGLRAIAALGIMVTHVAFQTGVESGSWWGRALGRFDYFVPVFFALSGFLLWRRHRFERSWSTYFVKRIGRLMPAYWVCVILVVVALPVGHIAGPPDFTTGGTGSLDRGLSASIPAFLASLVMLQNFVPYGLLGGITHLWSLSVEMSFYLLLPIFAIVLGKWPSRARIAGIAVFSLACLAWPWFPLLPAYPGPGEVNLQIFPPAFAPWFAVGMITAELEDRRYSAKGQDSRLWSRVDRVLRVRPVWWAVAAAALFVASCPWYGPQGLVHPSPLQFCLRVIAGTVFGAAVVVPYALAPGSRFLESDPMQAVGRWSYSVFLWHVAALSFTFPLLGIPMFSGHFVLILLSTVALTIPIAALSYTFVEDPARAWISMRWREHQERQRRQDVSAGGKDSEPHGHREQTAQA